MSLWCPECVAHLCGPRYGSLVEKGAAEALDDDLLLRPVEPGPLTLDVFELQQQLLLQLIVSTAEPTAIVGKHVVDRGAFSHEGRQGVVVHQL